MNFTKTIFGLSVMSIYMAGCDSARPEKTRFISMDLDENVVHAKLLTPDSLLRTMADLRQYKAYLLNAQSDTLAVSDIKDEFEFQEGENELVFMAQKEQVENLFGENARIDDGMLHVYQIGRNGQPDTLRLTQSFSWQHD